MSHSVPSRPLSLVPFLAADGVLLLTALLIAWRTSGELAGGALAGVVICTCLGALLTVLPFVLNDAREREAALAERQRELVDLVNSTTATASRWGAQWAAAATGLEDASTLAARSIAAADRAPAALQEKIDALTALLEHSERSARERDLLAAQRDELTVQRDALAARRDEALDGRSVEIAGVLATLRETAAEFGRVDAALREQHAAFTASLGEVPSVIARVQTARDALDEQLSGASDRSSAHVARITADAETRLTETAAAIAARVAELEAALAAVTGQLERFKALDLAALEARLSAPATAQPVESAPAADNPPERASAPTPAAPTNAMPAEILSTEEPAPQEPVAQVDETSREQPVLEVSVMTEALPEPMLDPTPAPASAPVAAAAKPVNVVCKDAIMDPFYIPENGYSALADAMDGERG